LPAVDNAEHVLKVKNLISLFNQTVDSYNFPTIATNSILLVLFDKYAELLKRRFSDDFLEIVSTDDYMPMPIQNAEEYEKVVNVSWYTPDRSVSDMVFPCVFPFSQMYPLCCIDIRNFLNQFYFFVASDFQHPEVVDERLKSALDDLLTTKVCASLVSKLSSQYLGQIVQILINISHFETACIELETLLVAARSSHHHSTTSTISLAATAAFRDHKKTAEKRIFELVNSKIDDLVETAEYDFSPPRPPAEPSTYIQTLTQYLSNIMSSVLLSLPTEIKELMLFNAISHTAESILALPLSPSVRRINPHGVQQLSVDVDFLTNYVSSLNNIALQDNLVELQQTVQLMGTANTDEFYDVQMRNKKYGRVDPLRGPQLLEKLTHEIQTPTSAPASAGDRFAALGARFGMHSNQGR
jgi:exocyst complex component 6